MKPQGEIFKTNFGGFFSIPKKIFEIVFDFVLKFENARL